MMRNKRAILILLCALSLPLPAPVLASDDLFSIMFRMMLTMMNVMSNAMDDDAGGFNNWDMGGTSNLGMSSMPMMGGMTGLSPWGMGMSPWSNVMPGTAMQGSPWGNPFTGGSSPWMPPGGGNGMPAFGPGSYPPQEQGISLLDGKWYGNSGEILEVRGNRFRLRSGKTGITGVIRIENNIVHLFSPQTGTVTRYTFVRNQTDLLLQESSGRLLGFHKRPANRSGYGY